MQVCVRLSPDDKRVVSAGGADGTVIQWRVGQPSTKWENSDVDGTGGSNIAAYNRIAVRSPLLTRPNNSTHTQIPHSVVCSKYSTSVMIMDVRS